MVSIIIVSVLVISILVPIVILKQNKSQQSRRTTTLVNKPNTIKEQITYKTASNQQSLAVADFNLDNKHDIVVGNTGNRSITIFLNTGNDTFHNQVTYPTGTQPFGVAVADFNLDNKVNIAVANYGDDVIYVHFNAGNGTFLSQTAYVADIVDLNAGTKTINVLLNVGNRTFLDQVIYGTGRQPVHVTVPDLNGDSKPDIIVANSDSNNIDVLLHR
ncbi:unnamed protein product [Adineta ricciae]|uniref:VCBS repeat-containing protein n=1 Tax=Adineta ricciae TaxID=249248 RepID=A0A815UXJ2_ADIRI|nr:unnamed protein product [Adineta ricciae]